MPELHRPGVAILASGSGTTAEAFIHATQDGRADLDVGLVISNRADAGVFNRVDQLKSRYGLDIETAHISKKRFPVREGEDWTRGQSMAESEAIAKLIEQRGIEIVLCLGYMLVIRGDLLELEPINSHPGILPLTANTMGEEASQKAITAGLQFTAHTIHRVDEGVDTGEILFATPVPIEPGDDAPRLNGKVQLVEKSILPLWVDSYVKLQRLGV